MEPELSNIEISSVGIGIRPIKEISLELVYHNYRQNHATDRLRSNIDTDPLGINSHLGEAVDLVFAYKSKVTNWRIKAIAAWFNPGKAFDVSFKNAFYARLETRYSF